MSEIEKAKKVVESHEQFVAAGDVPGVLSNMADEVVVLAPDTPLVEGHSAVRNLYEALFGMGDWEFVHDYSGASESGDLVLLHGVARGTLTPPGQDPSPFANNFMIVTRRSTSGATKVLRAAFAPSGE